MSERTINILAAMARRIPMRLIEQACAEQKTIGTARLSMYAEKAGDELAEYAHSLRLQYDADKAALAAKEARIAELETALRESCQYLDDNKLNQIGSGSKLHCLMRNTIAAQPSPAPVAASQGEEGREVPVGLTFNALRTANVERITSSKYRNCEESWTPAHWMQATVGELGELANLLKKVDRGDFPFEQVKTEVAKELADVQTYLDILALKLGVDLGQATVDKFNEVSDRIGSHVRLLAQPARQVDDEEALWAVHAQGPDELYAAGSKEKADRHAAALNALPMPEGIKVAAVVIPSPWSAVEHWKYLAEQNEQYADELRALLGK